MMASEIRPPPAPDDEALRPAWDSFEALRGSAMLDEARAYAAKRRRTRSGRRRLVQAGAGAVVILLAGWGAARWEPPFEAATPIGQVRELTLRDGSRVTLDGDSRIRVAYGPFQRRVRLLRGEAWFDVAKNRLRPFRVAAAGATVTAVGTAFDVAVDTSGVRVTLARGAVLVGARSPGPATAAVHLSPGDQVRLSASGALGERRRVPLTRIGVWRGGLIDLDGVPLAAALEQVNRRAARRVEVADPAALATPVSGVFHAGDERAFIEAISGLFGERCAAQADAAVVVCRPAAPAQPRRAGPEAAGG